MGILIKNQIDFRFSLIEKTKTIFKFQTKQSKKQASNGHCWWIFNNCVLFIESPFEWPSHVVVVLWLWKINMLQFLCIAFVNAVCLRSFIRANIGFGEQHAKLKWNAINNWRAVLHFDNMNGWILSCWFGKSFKVTI